MGEIAKILRDLERREIDEELDKAELRKGVPTAKHGFGAHEEYVTITRNGKTFKRRQRVGRKEQEQTQQKHAKPEEHGGGKQPKGEGKAAEEHASTTSDEKLIKYVKVGQDEKLRAIAIKELKRRGHDTDSISANHDKDGKPIAKKPEKTDGKNKAAEKPKKTVQEHWAAEIAAKYKLKGLPPPYVPKESVKVDLSGDVDSHIVMKWVDPKTKRSCRVYTEEFHKRKAMVKWERVMKLPDTFLSDVDGKCKKKLIGHKDSSLHEAGVVLSIIAQTGLRVGSDDSKEDTGNEGITTLSKKAIKVVGDEIHLDFIGKSHKRNVAIVKDAVLAKEVTKLMAGKKDNDMVFTVSRDKVIDTLRDELGYKGVKTKDLRTAMAGKLAVENLYGKQPPLPMPDDEKKGRKLIASRLKECFEYVSSKLNNTPAMARDSYVCPAIIEGWMKKIGVDSVAKGVKFEAGNEEENEDTITIPTLQEIGSEVNYPKLDEGLNPEDYDGKDGADQDDDITYPMPDWMQDLMDEFYPEEEENDEEDADPDEEIPEEKEKNDGSEKD